MSDTNTEKTIEKDRLSLRKRWYEEGWYSSLTVPEAMRRGALQKPNARYVFSSKEHPGEATLLEILKLSEELAGALNRMGLKAGDVVALQVPNRVEGIVIYQASLILGAVILPIVHIYGPNELEYILNNSGAKVFFCPDRWRKIDFLERLNRIDRSKLPNLKDIIIIGDQKLEGAISWKKLTAWASTDYKPPEIRPDDLSVLTYTSGTESSPKGVKHTHNTFLSNIRIVMMKSDKPDFTPFPTGHVASLVGLLGSYMVGNEIVFLDAWDASTAAMLIEKYRIGHFRGTGFFISEVLDAVKAEGRDISSWQKAMLGAGIIPLDVVERLEELGIIAYRSYGSSEHPSVARGYPGDPLDKRLNTDGKISKGTELRILDVLGNEQPQGTEGEIVVRGPGLFDGYLDRTLDKNAFLPGGWYSTSDIGFLDDEGYLKITDRKKDIIIRGGENISSQEVEEVLIGHEDIVDAAAVAMPDPKYGEKVCAFVRLRPGKSIDLLEIQKHFVKAGVAKHKSPERIEIVDDFPRTPAGKIKKRELREQVQRK